MPDADRPVLLTGAAGFIGSHIAHAMLARGSNVLGVDNLDPFYDAALKRLNLASLADAAPTPGAFRFVEADITDARTMSGLFAETRPHAVIHMAARAGVRPSIADPAGYSHVNVTGTSILFDLAHKHHCDRFILASSSSVYGNASTVPFSEDQDVSHPISPYAATKRACELLAHTHHHLTKMPTACLRFFTVFGPRQRPDLAINLFLKRVSAGEPVRMFGDGSSSRDYTYIDDIVSGVIASYDRIEGYGFRIWNLGGSSPISLADMIAAIGATVGKDPVIERAAMQPGDVERTFADLTRSGAELGYQPLTPFDEGLRRQWEWMKPLLQR